MLPEIRVNWTRLLLDYYARAVTDPAVLAAIRDVDTTHRQTVLAAGPLQWLSAEVHLAYVKAPLAALGHDRFRALWCDMTRESLERPVFRPLIQGALALFRQSPGRLVPALLAAWGLVARGCGTFTTTVRGPRAVDIAWTDVPALFATDDTFPTAWAGSMSVMPPMLGARGEVTMDARDLRDARVVLYRMTW